MVGEGEERLLGGWYSSSDSEALPEVVKVGEADGATGSRAERPDTVDDAIKTMIKTDGPVMFDCIVSKNENCFPMIPSGAAHNEMLLADEQGLEVEVSDAGKAMV